MANDNTLKKFIELKRSEWGVVEERAEELFNFTNDNLDVNQWEIVVKGYGRMPYQDFLTRARASIRFGRIEEVTNAMLDAFENIQSHFDNIKIRFSDVFRSHLNIIEEKKLTIDTMLEQIEESDEKVANIQLENDRLREENDKLRAINNFSKNGYQELWKIIEVKLDNLMELYQDIENINDKDELKSYLQAIRTELKVGIKPIEAKKRFILKEQMKEFGFNDEDVINKKDKEDSQKIEPDSQKIEPEKEIKVDTSKFKEELQKAKQSLIEEDDEEDLEDIEQEYDDYVVPDEEVKQNKLKKYMTFKIHKENYMYNEEDWDTTQPVSDEEKEIRDNLIRDLIQGENYALEREVDYSDKSNENRAKICALVQLHQELTHKNFGINSYRWLERYEDVYMDCLKIIDTDKTDKLNPTQLKMLDKL